MATPGGPPAQAPGKLIREYLNEEVEGETIWAGAMDNLTRLVEGVSFSVGISRGRTWFMMIATAFATFLCSEFVLDISWNTSLSIVAVGTVFPVVFSIQAAYQNREKSLKYLDDVKSGFCWLYFTFGEWDKLHSGSTQARCEETICKLMVAVMTVLRMPSDGDHKEAVSTVYDGFQQLIVQSHENTKVPPPWINGMQMQIKGIMHSFESVKTIKDTETPKGLRKLCYFLIITTPIMLGPYWAHFCRDDDPHDLDLMDYGCAAAYFVGLLYVIITSTLLRVQEALEDPFDGDGLDDINWTLFSAQMDKLPMHGVDGPKNRQEIEAAEEAAAKKEADAAPAAGKEADKTK
mmetsp:Transcript_19673/g.40076  ORF Transcript_19673/g.40076 Transcript_19673/m.40076 type:complete len:348 (+) Transcript_19673:36-1079(+)|eukprot:CAMPEP_0181324534 /NCGR_PEP_ID=MMETSP1101-20121128/20415_1 /TAXON_ID=46948 /ORGANISM="Rhodomonas abbreviata, Strain Caron Lab Isolate" /LENGTH=347 /DNA_ID=CAMNT_0023432725 /DNA_START=29 /DNA_END=1072 /DNA_ORIENTATION=-